jgi:hypothetical protein
LQCVLPGLWLGSITVESFKVTDAPGKVSLSFCFDLFYLFYY